MLSALSEKKLLEKYEKSSERLSKFIDEFITAGRGEERPSETNKKNDELSLRYREAAAQAYEIRFEMDARRTYHGSLKPIKRKVW